MAANWAKKEEFTVGWGFYPNNNTSAPYGAQTLVLSGFQGGGGATRKTRSTSAFRGTRNENNSCMSSRNRLRAIPTEISALRDLKQKFDTS